MNRVRATATLLLLGAVSCSAPDESTPANEPGAVAAEVAEAVAALTGAMNAHDRETVMSFYVDDPDFVYVGCTGFIFGGANFKRIVGSSYEANREVQFRQDVVNTKVLSPTAAVVTLRGGSTEAPDLFWTQTWESVEGQWRVVGVHESWPGCSEPQDSHPFTTPSDSSSLTG